MKHLRVLLEVGGDDDGRDVLFDREKIADHVAAHEKLDLSGNQQHAAVRLRAALHDRHVEPVFGVGAVDERLEVAAGLGIGEPVGPESDLVERKSGACESNEAGEPGQGGDAHC